MSILNHFASTMRFICQNVLVLNPSLDVSYFFRPSPHNMGWWWACHMSLVDRMRFMCGHLCVYFHRLYIGHLVMYVYIDVNHMHTQAFDYNLWSIIMYPWTASNKVRKVLSETKLWMLWMLEFDIIWLWNSKTLCTDASNLRSPCASHIGMQWTQRGSSSIIGPYDRMIRWYATFAKAMARRFERSGHGICQSWHVPFSF